MKSYTDIKQSKKLAEFLPLESADMFYSDIFIDEKHKYNSHYLETYGFKTFEDTKQKESKHLSFLPCWSLSALYDILPNNKKETTTLSRGGWKIEPIEYLDNWWCEYEDESHTKDFTVSANNSVDACVAMIEKLNELKLL